MTQSVPTGASPRALRIAHLTTVDMSLALLLGTELSVGVAAGHDLIGISAPGPYVADVESLGVTHVAIPALTRSWNPGQDLAAMRQLLTTLRRLDLDVLHTHNPKTGVMGRIAGRLAGIPVVVNTCHGLWAGPDDSRQKRAFVYSLEALAARFSDFELFQNAADRHTLRRVLKRGRNRVVGNGIDLDRFRPDPEGGRRLRREWGLPEDALVVGTVGRRVAEKGMAEFAQAAARLGDRARFVWVGPSDGEDALEARVGDSVMFVPEQRDMPAVYAAFDVFVLASYREGFSRASMEAAASARALVLSDIRGCREIGTDGVHADFAPAHDATALTAAIERQLDDPERRNRLGASARERAMATFDQRAIARISLETYAAVLGRRRWLRRTRRGTPVGGIK